MIVAFSSLFLTSPQVHFLLFCISHLPVLPNGPIRKVCVIISRVHCKEKTSYVLVFLWDG